jgi:lipoprotein-releasing system permease protein
MRSFVAWRYLVARPGKSRVSRAAVIAVVASLVLAALCRLARVAFDERVLDIASLVLVMTAGVSAFLGVLRGVFTFFTTVPVGGVWVGTAALVMVVSVMNGFEADVRAKILGSNAHVRITRDGSIDDWQAVRAKIDALPGVDASTPFGSSEVAIVASQPANVIIRGIDPATVGNVTDLVHDLTDPEAMKRLDPLVPDEAVRTDGAPVDFSTPRNGPRGDRTLALPGILVGRELARQLHLVTGEEIRVVSPIMDAANPDATGSPTPLYRDYRIAGVFYTGMYEYDLKSVYVSLESLQQFLDRGDTIDGIDIRVAHPDDTESLMREIADSVGPDYRIADWKELNKSLFSALTLEKIAMFMVLAIIIVVASFSIVGNLVMVVVEKQRQIAVLKTLGATDRDVMSVFALQGLTIGVVGSALGVATGLVACAAAIHFGLPLDENVYYIDRLPVDVQPLPVIATAIAGIVVSFGATFYPAMMAARVRASDGMRY